MRSNHLRPSIISTGGLEDAFRSLEMKLPTRLSTLKRGDTTLAAARFDADKILGQGYWELLRLAEDLFVVISNIQYPRKVSIPIAGEDLIEFHFQLSGSLQLMEGAGTTDIPQGSLLVYRQPKGCEIVEHMSAEGLRESSVTIYCRPSYLHRWFGDCLGLLHSELAHVLSPECESIRSVQAALYPALSRLVLDLAAQDDRSGVKLVRAEALVMQIISEALANVRGQKRPQPTDIRVSDRDVQRLRNAREIIVGQHAPSPTIDELGRRVGLSPTRLKSGFRLLFGQTVCEFANELRMTAAKELLRQSDKPIAHVSAELGYEYQNSFTVAFRRQFGILPKDYRRDPLAYDRTIA